MKGRFVDPVQLKLSLKEQRTLFSHVMQIRVL